MVIKSVASSRQSVARLVHDVGKYVARTARNLPDRLETSPDGVLLTMLIDDLYGASRPSATFQTLATGLEAPQLAKVRAIFAMLDALEGEVRAGQLAAVQRAASGARDIEEILRSLLREVRAGARGNGKTP